ncbi:MAG: hypothetical protein RLY88_782 [Actinomycetota bacterium]|jgi:arabinogalactan oligomer/maltooligosaccharide transport system permease protein
MNLFRSTKLIALIAKILILALATSVLGYMAFVAFLANEWLIGGSIVLVIVLANVIYGSGKLVAAKFLYPGIVFLALFVIVPVIYTAMMSTFNYKTGNEISKEEAIAQLYDVGLTQDAAGTTYDMVLGNKDGQLSVLLTDQITHKVFLAQNKSVTELPLGRYKTRQDGVAVSADGFTKLTTNQAANAESKLQNLKFPFGDGSFVVAQGVDVASRMIQAYSYDAKTNTLTDSVAGITYVDNGNGNFVDKNDSQVILYPGWRQFNPAENYIGLLTNPALRGPFIGVFIWTFLFSVITVVMMFGLGLVLALALDKKIRGRNFYRALLILPYAMPSFMSILIWAGIFNREHGALNALLGMQIPWLEQEWLAKFAILIVNLWLGFPYFYLISTGAIQALPGDLEEAAELDGASAGQIFWRIKLPLVLQILSPLLIASMAFNFNNFNLIFLLTKGGPTDVINGQTAGATDILITYAYKTAFSGAEQNLGLASAISVIIFLIVGVLSLWSLRRSKVLEIMQ